VDLVCFQTAIVIYCIDMIFRYNVLTVLTAANLINWIYLVISHVSAEQLIIGHLVISEAPFDRDDKG
jgi:hypothetical protein